MDSQGAGADNSARRQGGGRKRIAAAAVAAVLAGGIAAAATDIYLVRRDFQAAYNDLVDLQIDASPRTGDDVQRAFQREPAGKERKGEYVVELYRWCSRLTPACYNIYAVYSGDMRFLMHYKNELPAEAFWPSLDAAPRRTVAEIQAEGDGAVFDDDEITEQGQPAPDFSLRHRDGQGEVRLSQFAGKTPVALIFASYT